MSVDITCDFSYIGRKRESYDIALVSAYMKPLSLTNTLFWKLVKSSHSLCVNVADLNFSFDRSGEHNRYYKN